MRIISNYSKIGVNDNGPMVEFVSRLAFILEYQ